jgi:lactoylglutathione lyase
MKPNLPIPQVLTSNLALVIVFVLSMLLGSVRAAEPAGEFSKPVIDVGMVVRNADRSAAFLTNAIGFKEVSGFAVSAELGRKIGLLDGRPVNVRVFVLDNGDQATRIKLLHFSGTPPKQPDQTYVHSSLGIRYLTLYVKDINQALERLKKSAIPLLGDTPVDLGGGTLLVAVKDPDGNFLELIGQKR